MAKLDFADREFPMSDDNFEVIRRIAYEFTGITLSDHKKEMIYSRLSRRIRALRIGNFDRYCDILQSSHHEEHNEFINSITTNLTAFFRESHHFDFLKKTVLPELRQKNAASKRIRIWSAGCSTGEEPYSISMCIKDAAFAPDWDVKVLATDLDSNVVDKGRSGVYELDRINGIEEAHLKKWCLKDKSQEQGRLRMKPALQQLIAFKRLNLMEEWPMKGPFDVIFCRNVVIYFNKPTQRILFDRYADILKPGGYLFIGHSESLNKVTDRFESLGKTIYRKIK
jgi:chemotaxis protein methyltransferase CheR